MLLRYAVGLQLSSGQLVMLCAVELKSSAGQLLLYAVELQLSVVCRGVEVVCWRAGVDVCCGAEVICWTTGVAVCCGAAVVCWTAGIAVCCGAEASAGQLLLLYVVELKSSAG